MSRETPEEQLIRAVKMEILDHIMSGKSLEFTMIDSATGLTIQVTMGEDGKPILQRIPTPVKYSMNPYRLHNQYSGNASIQKPRLG
jgi:hypothetical protein